jgi:hypothetical protein
MIEELRGELLNEINFYSRLAKRNDDPPICVADFGRSNLFDLQYAAVGNLEMAEIAGLNTVPTCHDRACIELVLQDRALPCVCSVMLDALVHILSRG